jgi:restriction endonuclease Mrr
MPTTPLVSVLQNCSLHSLLMIVNKVLTRSGFGDVQILDRRTTRQKSRFGGHEIQCLTPLGSESAKVVVKVIPDSVRLRMLDELAGTTMRTGADLGILVSTHELSRELEAKLPLYTRARVMVVDGVKLASELKRLGIGFRADRTIDYDFFFGLEQVSHRLLAFLRQEAV